MLVVVVVVVVVVVIVLVILVVEVEVLVLVIVLVIRHPLYPPHLRKIQHPTNVIMTTCYAAKWDTIFVSALVRVWVHDLA